MNRKRYNYIRRLVEKITTSPSNNMEFCYYGHLVSLQSGTTDYVDVTVYNTADRYSGETADFSFDYWTKELDIGYTESDRLFDIIVQAFWRIYGKRSVHVIIEDPVECHSFMGHRKFCGNGIQGHGSP